MSYMGTGSNWDYDYLTININGDTTNNYYQQGFMRIRSNQSTLANMQNGFQSRISYDSVGTDYNSQTNPGVCELEMPRYSGTTKKKQGTARFGMLTSIQGQWNAGNGFSAPIAFWVYTPTSAITSVSLKQLSGAWKAGSKFSLYGISNS